MVQMFSFYQLVSTIIVEDYSCNVVRDLLPLTTPTFGLPLNCHPISYQQKLSSCPFAACAYFGYHFLAIITDLASWCLSVLNIYLAEIYFC